MAKPYNYDSPLITERGLEHIAEIIKTNYPTNEDMQKAVAGVDLSSVNNQIQQLQSTTQSLSSQVTQVESKVTEVTTKVGEVDISGLESRVSSIESDLDGLLTVLEEVVG